MAVTKPSYYISVLSEKIRENVSQISRFEENWCSFEKNFQKSRSVLCIGFAYYVQNSHSKPQRLELLETEMLRYYHNKPNNAKNIGAFYEWS